MITCLSLLANTNPDYTAIDEHARNAPDDLASSLADLTAYLIKPAKNDFEKTRAIFTWLAANVRYDVKAVTSPSPKRYPLEERIRRTLKYKKAVCQGYSETFRAMCQAAGLKAYFVTGWSKRDEQKSRVSREPDHAWNAIYLDDEWYVLDVTWAAGHVRPNKSGKNRFVRKFNDVHFLTPPATFVYRHLPSDPTWQLLDCPIDIATFKGGATAIQTKIAEGQNCYSYKDTIAALEQLELLDQSIATAKRAYEFDDNKKGKRILGGAYMKKAMALLNEEKNTFKWSKEDRMTYYDELIGTLTAAKKHIPSKENQKNIQQQLNMLKKRRKAL